MSIGSALKSGGRAKAGGGGRGAVGGGGGLTMRANWPIQFFLHKSYTHFTMRANWPRFRDEEIEIEIRASRREC